MDALLTQEDRVRVLQKALFKMNAASCVDPTLDLGDIAAQTDLYTASELETLVKVAQGSALSAQLKRSGGTPDERDIMLSKEDFVSAMEVVKPEKGSLKEELSQID